MKVRKNKAPRNHFDRVDMGYRKGVAKRPTLYIVRFARYSRDNLLDYRYRMRSSKFDVFPSSTLERFKAKRRARRC